MTVFVSLLVVRAGAIALMLTGMNLDRAKFQSLSAFSGTGFTTREPELVVNYSARRKIISVLMIAGHAGIVTVIITATSSFAFSTGVHPSIHVAVLLSGLGVIYFPARNKQFMTRWKEWVRRWLPHSVIFQKETLEEILHLGKGSVSPD